MDYSLETPGLGDLHEHGMGTTIQDLPDEILAKSLLGMEAPFSHRRISKQLRILFDERCTQLRIRDEGNLCPDPSNAHASCLQNKSAEGMFKHADLLSLLRRLPHLDTLLDKDRGRSQALPWEEIGQILGGRLTHLVFYCNSQQLSFLELFPSLRKLLVIRGEASQPVALHLQPLDLQPLDLQAPLSALRALQHLELRGLPAVRDLGPLTSYDQLQFLDVSGCSIEDLGPLVQCTKLHSLKLCCVNTLRDLGPLGACTSLQHLDLFGCSGITNLKPLELCTKLLRLDLSFSLAADFGALSSCTALQHVDLFKCVHLRSLAPLASCRNLQHLDLRLNIVSCLEPLWGLQGLQHLDLRGLRTSRLDKGPPELGPLTRVKHLRLDSPPGLR